MRTAIPFFLLSVTGVLSLAQPVITSGGVVNASGYQATLAPGTVFVIFGSGLGPAAIATATAPNYPPSLGGTSITFAPATGGAATAITAGMVYSVATQVAGFLPSSAAPGTYNVSVTYQNKTSATQTVTVVARSFGVATSNSAGTGPAQATIGNVNNGISLVRMTSGSVNFSGYAWTLSPAHPSDELVLWGTGGGADSANDTGGSSGDQTAAGNFSVTVDGTQITPLYAGTSAGYPGLWQINFVLPSNIAADCFAYLQVSAGGQLSNGVTIAIAQTGQTSCSSAIPAATLSKLDSGTGTVTMAGLNVGQLLGAFPSASVGGVINRYTVAEFLLPLIGPKIGACTVLQETYPEGGKEPAAADAQLDAGVLSISANGSAPQTLGKISAPAGPTYNSSIPITSGATYTLTGAGGPQVGPFTASTTFPASFSVTNFSSISTQINRSQPLTINWTGSGFSLVKISINTEVLANSTNHTVIVNCDVPASAGTYTVPAAALQYLLPSATLTQFQVIADMNNGGTQTAETTTDPNTIIPLTAGGLVDFGGFGFYVDYLATPIIQ